MKKLLMTVGVALATAIAFGALPDGGPYKEVVDGLEWTFMVTNGTASVWGDVFGEETAIPQETMGAITIPATLGGRTVTKIMTRAFDGCSSLTGVSIPKTVTSIEQSAFANCLGLGEGITVIDDCLVDIPRDFDDLPSSFDVPQGVRLIADFTFSFHAELRSVTFPSSLMYIGGGAFSGDSNLRSVTFSSSITSIGEYAFQVCTGLSQITLEEGLINIGNRAFEGCTGLTSITIPASVKNIEGAPFSGCNGLTQITVASGNTAYAINKQLLCTKDGKCVIACPGALAAVTIPKTVTSIRTGVFTSGMQETISVESGNKSFSVRNKLLCDVDGKTAIACPGMAKEIEISSTVSRIAERAFEDCSKLATITIPSTVKAIGQEAFSGCTSLESVVIYPGITRLELATFGECGSLKEIAVPEGVTSIGGMAFYNCPSLEDVKIPESVETIERTAFIGSESLHVVHVEPGDKSRVKKMLKSCYVDWELNVVAADVVTIIEDYDPEPGPVPPGPGPEPEEGFEEAHTFNGLVYAGEVMCGIVQVTTSKRTAKDQVKVGGFVMLTDGKKQTIKSVTEDIEGGKVNVDTKAGKLGEMELEITDDGFTGSVGLMTVKSGDIGEDTGIISGTLKMSYFDAKTNKLKTRSIKLGGVASGGEAAGTLETKGEDTKVFSAVIE